MMLIFGGKDSIVDLALELALEVDLVSLQVCQSTVSGSQESLTGTQVPFSIKVDKC